MCGVNDKSTILQCDFLRSEETTVSGLLTLGVFSLLHATQLLTFDLQAQLNDNTPHLDGNISPSMSRRPQRHDNQPGEAFILSLLIDLGVFFAHRLVTRLYDHSSVLNY